MAERRIFSADLLTRVEGEGRFRVRVEGDRVIEAELSIFEAPRLFEALLVGRHFEEVPDIVARICGICPVAYQMSASRALEEALGFAPSHALRALRRLLYCGEWIESHALHVFMLHAPDYLGYAGAVEMAKDHRELVERGLRLKKAGNALIELLGGRATHPVSPQVGGFSKVPSAAALRAFAPALERSLEDAVDAVRWAGSLTFPEASGSYVFVALDAGEDYPLEWGDRVAISGREAIAVSDFEAHFVETQVPHSNALQSRTRDGAAYLCGPMARLYHHHEKLHPIARDALAQSGLALPVTNPFASIVVRAVEIVHACAEALDLIAAYAPPAPARHTLSPRPSEATGATEAPRGLLWHRYALDADGLVVRARIVPPTSQNQARIEQDLIELVPTLLALPHADAVHRCEQLVRAYDPCISCATHFLRLELERA